MIAENLREIQESLRGGVTLVAVSKTKPNEDLVEAYEAGQRHFGENRVQEMVDKQASLPKDIQWHMIGHVQDNKIKYMAPFVHLVHGIDKEKRLKTLNKEAAKVDRIIDYLLQVHIAEEDTKFGFSPEELMETVQKDLQALYPHTRLRGLMGMATFTVNQEQIRREFQSLKTLFDRVKVDLGKDFDILSMGMSGDYQIAMEEGSNMVRVGSSIFGARS